jgi:hypothetical protein
VSGRIYIHPSNGVNVQQVGQSEDAFTYRISMEYRIDPDAWFLTLDEMGVDVHMPLDEELVGFETPEDDT